MAEERTEVRRHAILFLAAFMILIAGGVVLSFIFSQETEKFYHKQLTSVMDYVKTQGESLQKTKEEEEEAFDKIYSSKVRFAAYAIQKDAGFAREDSWVKGLRDRLECTNIYIVGRRGKPIAGSENTGIDFYRVRYQQLRSVFQENKASEPFSVTQEDGKTYRYYGAKINEDCEVVVEEDEQALEDLLIKTGDWKTLLKPACISGKAYAYVVSDLDGSILYDSRGFEASDTIETYGENPDDLKDGEIRGKLQNESEMIGTVYLPDQKAYVRIVLPKADLTGVMGRFLPGILVLMTVFLLMVIMARRGRQAVQVALTGLVAMFAFGFLFSWLYGISLENYKEKVVAGRMEKIETIRRDMYENLLEKSNEAYGNHMNAAADILGRNEFMRNRTELKNISDALGLDYIMIYDNAMKEIETSGDYVNLNLSKDADDPFYVLSDLRFGVSERIWGPDEDPITGEYHQYIGVPLKKNGNPDGFLLGSVLPDRLLVEAGASVTGYEKGFSGQATPERTGQKDTQKEKKSTLAGFYTKKSPEALGKQAFGYTILIGGGSMAGLALILILRKLLNEEKEERESREPISCFTIPLVLRLAAVFVSLAALFWTLFPGSGLPAWSALRAIIETMFYGKARAYSEAAGIYGRGPGVSAVTAGLLAAGLFYLAICLTGYVSGRIVRAAGERTGQRVRAICRFIQIIMVVILINLVLYFFGVPGPVLGFAAVLVIAAVGLGGNTVIGDMIAGLWILLAGILHTGDFVEVEGRSGRVEEIHLTYTDLIREDGDRIVIGNRVFAQRGLRIRKSGL